MDYKINTNKTASEGQKPELKNSDSGGSLILRILPYIRQSLQLIKDNRLLSSITIIGTALSIAVIMCIVLVFRARTGNYEPEVNRDRTLSIKGAVARNKNDDGWNNRIL